MRPSSPLPEDSKRRQHYLFNCTEDEKVDEVVEIIKDKSHKRKQFVPSAAAYGIGTYTSFPVEVSVGGATIFITDVERFEKV